MAGLFGSDEYDKLADKNPKEYYKKTPFARSLWERRLPTWLGQAYKQVVEPAIDKLPSPTTMEGALTYAKMPYKFLKTMATGATDTIKSSMDDPTNAKKSLELALMTSGAGGLLGRVPEGPGKVLGMSGGRAPETKKDIGDMARALMDKVESSHTPNPRTGSIDVPYTSRKLFPENVDELNKGRVVEDNNLYEPPKVVTPEQLQHDKSSILSMAWDRADVGSLTSFDGRKLKNPQTLDGGNAYSRGLGLGSGASGSGPINRAVGAVRRQEGKPLYAMFSSMGGESVDFSKMATRAVLDGFDPKILNIKDKKRFDEKFLSLKGSPALKKSQKSFPGIGNKNLTRWLESDGSNRYNFMKHLDKAEWYNLGFPNAAAARHAVTDPVLLNLPNGVVGYGGHSISLMDPKAIKRPVADTPSPHATYPEDIPKKEYTGQLLAPVPRPISFPKWFNERRDSGALPRSDNKSFEFQTVVQPVTNKWVDTNSIYQEEFLKELAKRSDEKNLLKGLLR